MDPGFIPEIGIAEDYIHPDIQLPYEPLADKIVESIRQTMLEINGVNDREVAREA